MFIITQMSEILNVDNISKFVVTKSDDKKSIFIMAIDMNGAKSTVGQYKDIDDFASNYKCFKFNKQSSILE